MSSTSEAASQRGAAAGAATPTSGRGRLRPTFDVPSPPCRRPRRSLLVAAKAIIASDGFDALTLNSVRGVGREQGDDPYYFGNKAGLVAAVLDSVIHDEYVASQTA